MAMVFITILMEKHMRGSLKMACIMARAYLLGLLDQDMRGSGIKDRELAMVFILGMMEPYMRGSGRMGCHMARELKLWLMEKNMRESGTMG